MALLEIIQINLQMRFEIVFDVRLLFVHHVSHAKGRENIGSGGVVSWTFLRLGLLLSEAGCSRSKAR